ncbi:hypothetical protein O181_115916 [Austropuccinia psidii MF-1]|uniref:Uncharacterized protein n=1 Tax=Austropuccinia psidii MF-1 TaxID=1389203 RepID=A0A9Q3PWL2_9BASI|nr:hypothetical protein [Austropuccinia psidii MF-1]
MEPDFKEGDQVLVSILNFNNLKGPKKMRDSFLGPFTIIKLIGKNAVTRENLVSISLDLVGHVTSASRQRRLSHASHENVTQSPNPFQHYSQCSGNFTSLASTTPPNPARCFACLQARTALQMRLQHCPPISILTTPYAFTPPPLPSLCSRVPSPHAPNTAYHPYARRVHSRHAPGTTYPYAYVVPSRHDPNTTYPYACVVPSQHAPDTTYPDA